MPLSSTHRVRSMLPSLERFGIAVRHFSKYVATFPDPHQVDVLLVSFVVSGHARHVIDDAEFEAAAGSVGITRPGEAHYLITGEEGIEVYNVFLDPVRYPLSPAPLRLHKTQQILFPPDDAFCTRLNRAVHFEVPHPESLRHCLELLVKECEAPGAGSAEIIESLQRVFVLSCCRAALSSGIEPAQPPGRTTPRWVLELCAHMDAHSADPITLDDLCGRCRLSRGHLCRAFKFHVGVTPMEYLVQRRIETAKQALRSGGEKILVIALESGFNDLSHFNRSFKTHTGQTPSAYRKR